MNNFGQIASAVGTRVGDTSATFATVINGYINQRYQRVFKKFNFSTINPSYTLTTVGGQSDYVLPADFKNEIYVYDSLNFNDIKRIDFEELERVYQQMLQQSGSVWKYTIFDSLNTSSPAALQKTIRFFEIPTGVITYNIPYIQVGAKLVNSTDLPIIDMSDLAAELGATADAWRTKRQFQKASDFELQYEQVILEMIWSIENNPNRIVQFRPTVYSRDNLYGGDGTSYYYAE